MPLRLVQVNIINNGILLLKKKKYGLLIFENDNTLKTMKMCVDKNVILMSKHRTLFSLKMSRLLFVKEII